MCEECRDSCDTQLSIPSLNVAPDMICPSCHTENPDQARFCLNCGHALESARHPEGERRRVAVLFADVVGSTAMAERRDPEEMVDIMNGAFDFMTAAITRYDGTVARLMGDAVLAFFGAPVAHEDDAERAVRAALDIRDQAREYAVRVRRRYGADFGVRVGINTGLVVAGEVGSASTAEYTAMGDTPNVAARIQAAAQPGTVLISDSTYRLVRHAVDVEPRGVLEVRGRSQSVGTYEVAGLKAVRESARGLEGVHSPLVGREGEFEHLAAAVSAVADGRGAMVAVVGEAGLGKSRLVTEVREQSATERVRWLEGRGLSYAQSLAYYPWRQVIRQAVGAQENDTPARIRERLNVEVCTCCKRPGGDLPFLESILAVESEASAQQLASLEGDALVEHLGDSVEGYLCSLAQLRPTVVVFDDLHWADGPTLSLIERMAAVLQEHPLLFICVLRPDRDGPVEAMLGRVEGILGDRFSALELEALDASRTRELLGNLLHVEDLPESIRTTILQRADGNPFFLEEVLRSLIDSGHIVRENGHWRATREIADVRIPDTLAGVLSARIDRLPDVTKRVAQTAAVLGRIFEHDVLTDVCLRAPESERIAEVDPHLATLTYEELVREKARDPALAYIFKHALTQETAYDLLLVRRRRELHRRAGEALETLRGDRADEIAPILARHFFVGEDWERAARYAERAARRANKLYVLEDALEFYQIAVDALEKLGPEKLPDLIDASLDWVDVAVRRRLHEQVERREEILARLERIVESARALGNRRRLARALVTEGNVLTLSGRAGLAFPLLLEANELATELDDEEGLFLLPFFAISESLLHQDPRRAVEVFGQIIELAEKHRDRGIQAHATAVKAAAHARLGEADAAHALIAEALAMIPATNSTMMEADVHITVGVAYYALGEVERGIEHTVRGGEVAHSVQGIECACAGYAYAGYGNLEAERPQQALEELARALAVANASEQELVQMDAFLEQVQGWQALALARQGDAAALRRVEEALAKAEKNDDAFGAAFLHASLGDIYLEDARYEEAQQHLEPALAFYRERGMRPYVGRTLSSLAVLHERDGRRERAGELRAEAQTFLAPLALVAADDPISPTHGEAGYSGG